MVCMEEILTQFTSTQITYALGALLVINSIFLLLLLILFIRLGKIFKGNTGKNLESVISTLVSHKEKVDVFQKEAIETFINHDERIKKSAHAPHVLRFDAFNGTGDGGKQSFATALVSEDGNGMVLSSLYIRDKMRIYAKPVENYSSSFELTEEEQAVLKHSKK